MRKTKIKSLIILSALLGCSIQSSIAQNTERRNMNQDSTSLVPFGLMNSATTNNTTNTSTYTSPPPPFNGSCGASNNSILTSSPTSFLCATGTASAVTNNGGTYSWSCSGNNYGNPSNVVSCSAQERVVSQCGSDNGRTLPYDSTSQYYRPGDTGYLVNLCNSGAASSVYSDGNNPTIGIRHSWTCSGNYGAPVSCSAITETYFMRYGSRSSTRTYQGRDSISK